MHLAEYQIGDNSGHLFQPVDTLDTNLMRELWIFNESRNQIELSNNYCPQTLESFCRQFLHNNISGIIIRNKAGDITATLFGFPIEFNKNDYQLTQDVPDAKYTFLFGLGSTANEISILLALYQGALKLFSTDYFVGHVWDNSPIGNRRIYDLIGAVRVPTTRERYGNQGAYYYLKTKPFLRG